MSVITLGEMVYKLCIITIMCHLLHLLDPPLSGGLIKYQELPAALLNFTIVATALFVLFALLLLVSNTALKRNKYVCLLMH